MEINGNSLVSSGYVAPSTKKECRSELVHSIGIWTIVPLIFIVSEENKNSTAMQKRADLDMETGNPNTN